MRGPTRWLLSRSNASARAGQLSASAASLSCATLSHIATEIKSLTMPNFEVRITAGATRAIWTDTPTMTKPSRLNANEARPHSYRQCIVSQTVTLSAIVDGVVGPLDADLDGAEFSWWFAECPAWPAPSMSTPAGQSAVVSFAPLHPGLHVAVGSRASGGRVLVPFEAVGT